VRTERLQALADGVFAIALTLLVLELPAPVHSDRLGHDLLAQWPSYAAYVVSFVTVAIVWINHHALLDAVRSADRTLVELNLLLLLFVAAVPWPTGLVAEYLRRPGQSSAAAVTYGLVMTAMSAAFTLVWVRLTRAPHLLRDATRPRVARALRRSAVGPVAYAAGTVLAAVDATAAFVAFAAVAGYFAVTARRAHPGGTTVTTVLPR
jgi:uncharacterized membrane protein